MSQILCSIIIPYYNVPSILVNKCLNSILNQDWGNECYEVIFINDGSPLPIDESTKSIFAKFKHFTLIEQENQGPGGARNQGISIAKGNYLFFVDPDDFWVRNSIISLLPHLKKAVFDIIKFSTIRSNVKQGNRYDFHCLSNEYMSKHTILKGVCTYCFRTDFIKTQKLLMPILHNSEDTIFLFYAFYKAKTYLQTNINLYYYYDRDNSLTKQPNSNAWARILNDSLAGIKQITQFKNNEIKNKNITTLQLSALNRAYFTIIIDHIYMIFKGNHCKREREVHLTKLQEIISFPLPQIKHSFKYTLFRISSSNYSLMLVLCKLINFAYRLQGKNY